MCVKMKFIHTECRFECFKVLRQRKIVCIYAHSLARRYIGSSDDWLRLIEIVANDVNGKRDQKSSNSY